MKSESTENKGKPHSSVPSTLPTTLVQSLVDNYRDNQLSFINENLGIDDAHSIWFDLPTLKSFIQNIEEQAQLIDPNIPDADLGVRFYYAAYPEVPQDPIPSDYGKRHTLVMIPTKIEAGLNYDFNPFEEEGRALGVTAIKPVMAMAQNHGCLVPPNASQVESY
ncbi:hypothetical protein [Chryseobacterium sp. GP-SGM7]|uniref:hypothetical protein n=1 Tax=Chryseobacterium sp. GP-SGM7 TaxID=3411323 RepID=UPI003B95A712